MRQMTSDVIRAAQNKRRWGRCMAVAFCAKRGIPRRLLTLACQLEAVKEFGK